MNTRKKFTWFIIGALLAVLVVAPIWSASAQAPSPQTNGGTVQGGFDNNSPLVVPAAAFNSDGYLSSNSTMFWFSAGVLEGGSANYGCSMAPVYLPNLAHVNYVYVTLRDNDATYNFNVSLWKVQHYIGDLTHLGNLNTSGASASIQRLYFSVATTPVNYNYEYYLTTCLYSAETEIISARLYYTTGYESYIPVASKH